MEHSAELDQSTIAAIGEPVTESARIETLDVLRGFALLGILLLNILGMGMHSASYTTPGTDLSGGGVIDLWVWAIVDIGFEGVMRALFSLLFGAGVVLFATGDKARSAGAFYRRHFWLLIFGLIDGFILLWNGDILATYAIVGAFLYLLRNLSAQKLLIISGVLLVLFAVSNAALSFGLAASKDAAITVAEQGENVDPELQEVANIWKEFEQDMMSNLSVEEELQQRRESYSSAFTWNVEQMLGMLLFVLPSFMFWDALIMMLIGMALYKMKVLDGSRSKRFYLRMMLAGFLVGLTINSYEVASVLKSNFAALDSLLIFSWTYNFGRLGVALGWLGMVMLICKSGAFIDLRRRLAATGRMALTNYLMHSLIALFLFTGAGFALVGELNRWMLYPIVIAIWIFQLIFSPWWLSRYRFGPGEWIWRALTYWRLPKMKKT